MYHISNFFAKIFNIKLQNFMTMSITFNLLAWSGVLIQTPLRELKKAFYVDEFVVVFMSLQMNNV